MVSFLLLTSRERTACDWIVAIGLDLLTVAWIALLVSWWV